LQLHWNQIICYNCFSQHGDLQYYHTEMLWCFIMCRCNGITTFIILALHVLEMYSIIILKVCAVLLCAVD